MTKCTYQTTQTIIYKLYKAGMMIIFSSSYINSDSSYFFVLNHIVLDRTNATCLHLCVIGYLVNANKLDYVSQESYIVTKSVTVLVTFLSSCLGSSFQLMSKFDLRYSSLTSKSIGNEIIVEVMKAYGIQSVLLSIQM